MTKKSILTIIVILGAVCTKAQTNLQVFYDFGGDRKHVTTTLEGFYGDKWGNTFFFVDYDYASKDPDGKVCAPNGTYFEIARCLNFWKGSRLAPLSLHVEYNGGAYNGYTINNAFLFGLDYFIHSPDYKNTFNIKALYKTINYAKGKNLDGSKKRSDLPLQFTLVWGLKDLFGLNGLSFSGFADFWWEDHTVCPYIKDESKGYRDWSKAKDSKFVFLSEPQLWYNVGRHIGVTNLNVGAELELSYDFGTGKGFFARPCLGLKWEF